MYPTPHQEVLLSPAFLVRSRPRLSAATQVLSAIAHHHTIIVPRISFFLQGISWSLLFDVVGRRQRSPSYPPSLLGAKVRPFCFALDRLFYFILFDLIPLSCKNTHLLSCSFVYLFGVLGGHCTYDGRSLLPDPPHRSFSNRLRTFFSGQNFLGFPFPLYHMARHLRVNSCPLGVYLYIFPHTYHTIPTFPSALPFGPSRRRFLGVRPTACSRSSLLGFRTLGQSPCHHFVYDGRALRPLSV